MDLLTFTGNIVDIINKRIFPGSITIENGKIAKIMENEEIYEHYIMPGFIDAHVHIESSMLIPSEFARIASVHGTVATVSDPHEIANVLGIEGVNFMLDNAEQVPFKFFFGAPSCVPATQFETSGGEINGKEIRKLFKNDKIKYLSEMMNFPGVLYKIPEVIEKINIAKEFNKPIDGHAPGLRGEEASRYISAGISTDHEAFMLEEAEEKINYGMKILIREGSAAKNFDNLHSLISTHTGMCMLCSDDKHPDDLIKGHINLLVKKAIILGHDIFNVLQVAILNSIYHYKLDVGTLQLNDDADFIIVDNLIDFKVLKTFVKGTLIAQSGNTLITQIKSEHLNNFKTDLKKPEDFKIEAKSDKMKVIEIIPGEIVTGESIVSVKSVNGYAEPDIPNNILKIAVVNRYQNTKPAIAFIKNFGIKKGAAASSVAHDSHNIIAIGCNDNDLCESVNNIIINKGGLSVYDGKESYTLSLPIAGLMSDEDAYSVAERYQLLENKVKELGSPLISPFMTLSFMTLIVIPKLKLSDKGLFNVDKFGFTEMFL